MLLTPVTSESLGAWSVFVSVYAYAQLGSVFVTARLVGEEHAQPVNAIAFRSAVRHPCVSHALNPVDVLEMEFTRPVPMNQPTGVQQHFGIFIKTKSSMQHGRTPIGLVQVTKFFYRQSKTKLNLRASVLVWSNCEVQL